jgi:AcrR family transcriptional regulator
MQPIQPRHPDVVSGDDPATMSPREQRRRIRLDTTRTQVLDAAEHAFAANGFHATTIKSIAERCEIAVGTIYTLFDDKESVYEAVLRRRGETLKVLTADKASEPGRADERLVELADLQIRYFREHPDWTSIASALVSGSRAAPSGEGTSPLYETGHQIVADVVAAVIAAGQHSGVVREGNPQALALIFLGMVETFHRLDTTGVDSPDFRLPAFLDLIHAAFSAAPSPTRGPDDA